MRRCAVFGTGSWGTAMSIVLADAGNEVVMVGRREAQIAAINADHENADYTPGIRLPDTVRATTDAAEALAGAEFAYLTVPAQTLRANLTAWKDLIGPETVLVSLMKGLEVGTAKRMTEVIREVTGFGRERVAVLSGPNLSPEIARRQPAASVVAGRDEDVVLRLQAETNGPYFRTYTASDVTGVELGGVVKNVIGLAVGIADGMGFGDNTKATLITRGLAETARLGAALGADPYTFSGLAGLGDLVATCASPLSRNRNFGMYLGRGLTLEQAQAEVKQTAEGVKSCEAVLELADRHGVEMPIAETVVAIVHDGRAPAEMLKELMTRPLKAERHGH
ncbi:NAD(P)-dependent glycerol-3-phosphate dehydrogenase [Catenulispora sp. NF23]|uniref:Glycerol-3-phosphate dehydrogenase [NAD(P)+] n=1 Tax=Catenulispora pinistramenti TaxID=2705254 RepID=A0ABS5KLU4_9ACTN|nr:NAD(P)H-dependent glycerol-3-phosphate dehydrogenase [Catenulispora pinistramenti]MBS2531444.1 NAD(P)-dependent glycerol-3-phosphate dehydrogenase [Catenulispora pinistramenti]MBS2547018.1 NAD(P)-dependent glycerol-3-phosphate dehydrogenase [Catenulispora pinistramenti]